MSTPDSKNLSRPLESSGRAQATRADIEKMNGRLIELGDGSLMFSCPGAGIRWIWRHMSGSGKSATYERVE